jgi:L-iditol 2-dehydrogenase
MLGSCRTLKLLAPKSLSLETASPPIPGPGELLIRVEAAATDGTDLKAWRRGHPQIPMPGPFGHEWAGTVASAGEGAALLPGEPVMGVHTAPCGDCRWCRKGQDNLCETIMDQKVLGAYADFLLIPARIASRHVFPRPAGLSAPEACLLEPLACVAEAWSRIEASGAESALIIGAGSIAMMFSAVLAAAGLRPVVAARRIEAARLAEGFGGAPALLSEAIGRHDLVIECTGAPEVWELALERCGRGGTLVLFGGCPQGSTARFDTGRLHYDDIRMISPFHFGAGAVRRARSWLIEAPDRYSPLLSGERPLEEAPAVFEDLDQGRGLKWVIRP